MKWYIKVLTNYATFTGRARRKEYWMFTLFNTIISIILSLIDIFVLERPEGLNIGNLYSIIMLLPSLGVAVRRMHDVNKSGWYILIPIYNLILCVTEGDSGDNEYGSDPKLGERSNDLLDN